ncbi:hypothetical protein ISS96_03030 [Candidatus Bathyarchaeota archaeon]|nr:hypothetical protein [Candidatus Bathyarchaeota archaeon]
MLSSNVYQILRTDERKEFRETIARKSNPNGLLFLSTLSARDPEHSGKGTPSTGNPIRITRGNRRSVIKGSHLWETG